MVDNSPAKPDWGTQPPRPPRAPRRYGGSTQTRRPLGGVRYPLPPEEIWGPPLEWDAGFALRRLVAGLGVALIFGGFSAIGLASARPSAYKLELGIYLFFVTALGCWIIYRQGRRRWLVAGARWVQQGKRWVSLDELTDIKIGAVGASQTFSLTDSAGRKVRDFHLWPVQSHPLLWDLIYAGMCRSIANGTVRPSIRAQRLSMLPDAPVTGSPPGSGPLGGARHQRERGTFDGRQIAAIVFLSVISVFFGCIGVASLIGAETADLRAGGAALLSLALMVSVWTCWGIRDTVRPSRAATPAVVVIPACLLGGVTGVFFVMVGYVLGGSIMVVLGIWAVLWQIRISIQQRRLGREAAPSRHHDIAT